MPRDLGKMIKLHMLLPDFPVWQYERGLVCGGVDWNGNKYVVPLYTPQQTDKKEAIVCFSKPIFGFDRLLYEDRQAASSIASLKFLFRVY
jgi:hypothetical protein